MSALEWGGGLGLNTRERIVIAGKASTDPLPLKTLDSKPATVLYIETQIPEDRKSLRYSVIFLGRSSQFIFDSIRQGQEMIVHGFLVAVPSIIGMRTHSVYHIEAEQLELDEGFDIRRKPLTRPWFALNMPNPDL